MAFRHADSVVVKFGGMNMACRDVSKWRTTGGATVERERVKVDAVRCETGAALLKATAEDAVARVMLCSKSVDPSAVQ
jgi:hypothetical protein